MFYCKRMGNICRLLYLLIKNCRIFAVSITKGANNIKLLLTKAFLIESLFYSPPLEPTQNLSNSVRYCCNCDFNGCKSYRV